MWIALFDSCQFVQNSVNSVARSCSVADVSAKVASSVCLFSFIFILFKKRIC